MKPKSAAGILVAAFVAAPCVLPSLVPRSAPIQGLLLGVLLAIGYGLGVAASRAFGRTGAPGWRTWAAAAVILLVALALGLYWQHEVSTLSGVAPPGPAWIVLALLVALVVFGLLLAAARGIRRLTGITDRGLRRLAPPQVSRVFAIGLVAVVGVGVVGRAPEIVTALGQPLFERMNASTPAGVTPPQSAFVSGGPASGISWQALGSQGRAFVAGVSDRGALEQFSGRPARNPIRAFVGVDSADTDEQRAALAVSELERFGAFDRSVIAVGTSAGSGTVDPGEVVPLEYLLNGDVATVSTQYSILPSFLSILVDTANSIEASRTLFDAVQARAQQEKRPPRVVVFGESLGAYGANGAFTDLGDLTSRSGGAMFQGPPNSTRMWRTLTADRQAGSPEVLPVYDQGRSVRWANQPTDLSQPPTPFLAPRVVYLQNASDPVVWWSPSLALRRPDWLAEPRGPGVVPWLPWLPVYTFAGLTGDMINSQGVPAGHGHVYGTDPVVAWANILRPSGWTAADTARLQQQLG